MLILTHPTFSCHRARIVSDIFCLCSKVRGRPPMGLARGFVSRTTYGFHQSFESLAAAAFASRHNPCTYCTTSFSVFRRSSCSLKIPGLRGSRRCLESNIVLLDSAEYSFRSFAT